MILNRTPLLAGAASVVALVLAEPAAAQTATALLREGDPLPAAGVGQAVTSINNTAVNGVGGYSATINTTDGVTTLSHAWGNATGGPGGILLSEGLFGSLQQTSWETFFGMDDAGNIAYSPSSDDTGSGATGLDGAWLNGTVLANEDDPIPSLPGKVYRFNSRVGITNNGFAYWVAGINDQATGTSEGNGLATAAGTILHKSGDVIPGLPSPLGSSAIDFDLRFSALATHYLVGVDTDAASTADFFLLLDGVPLSTSAGLIGEGQPLPADAGGLAGENWDNFDFLGVNEAGDTMFTGDTDGAAATDEFIAFNGKIVYREGDVVDGETLTGSIEGATMNENCDIAYIWDIVDTINGGDVEALFLNNKLLLKEGDAVDLDGDGVVEPTSIVANFTGISALTMGPNRRLYFTADIDVNGTSTTSDDIEGFFFLDDPCGSSVQRNGVGCVGSNGLVPSFALDGCLQNGSSVTLSLGNGQSFGTAAILFGLSKGATPIGPPDCTLNIGGVFGAPLFVPLDGTGSQLLAVPIAGLPSGATFSMQAFFGDGATPLGFVVSNGLRVVAG
ncbi:MAG: hypothetical protein ACF8XB_21890 [Planctomycetota bacterium JB042]